MVQNDPLLSAENEEAANLAFGQSIVSRGQDCTAELEFLKNNNVWNLAQLSATLCLIWRSMAIAEIYPILIQYLIVSILKMIEDVGFDLTYPGLPWPK